MNKEEQERVHVLYVAGVPRSGSTLIGRILGQAKGTFHGGEIMDMLSQVRGNGQCECGKKISSCPEWKKVLEVAKEGQGEVDLQGFHKIGKSLRARNLIFAEPPREVEEPSVGSLYEKIKDAHQANIIVDSSKFPSFLYVLSRNAKVKVSVIHVVRDPRAVANSWWNRPLDDKQNNKSWREMELSEINFLNPLRCSLIWVEWNYIIRRLWGNEDRYFFLKYEDFCQHPRSSIEKALEALGIEERPSWEDEATICLSPQHSVKGNPNRFKRGKTHIVNRSGWQRSMNPVLKYAVTLLTLPLLFQYGYKINP